MLRIVIFFVPLGKLPQSLADANSGFESIVIFQPFAISISDRNIARLHTDQLTVSFEIIVSWKNACTNELFLKCADVIKQVFRSATADVVNGVASMNDLSMLYT